MCDKNEKIWHIFSRCFSSTKVHIFRYLQQIEVLFFRIEQMSPIRAHYDRIKFQFFIQIYCVAIHILINNSFLNSYWNSY